MGAKGCRDLLLCKFLAQEVTLHIFFIGLGDCLNQSVPCNGQILLNIFRNLTLLIVAQLGKAPSCHLNYIDKAHKFFIFTNRKLEGGDLTAKSRLQLYNQLSVASVIIVHVGNENQFRETVLFAKLPGLLCPRFYARFAVYNNNSGVSYADCLLHLSYKIEESRSI